MRGGPPPSARRATPRARASAPAAAAGWPRAPVRYEHTGTAYTSADLARQAQVLTRAASAGSARAARGAARPPSRRPAPGRSRRLRPVRAGRTRSHGDRRREPGPARRRPGLDPRGRGLAVRHLARYRGRRRRFLVLSAERRLRGVRRRARLPPATTAPRLTDVIWAVLGSPGWPSVAPGTPPGLTIGPPAPAGSNSRPSRRGEGTVNDVRDLIIIGRARAGYTAAIYAARADLRPLVFEGAVTAGGALMNTTEVENFPGFPRGHPGPRPHGEPAGAGRALRRRARARGRRRRRLHGEVKEVVTGDPQWGGQTVHRARAVILATGSAYRELGLPNEKRLSGHGCQLVRHLRRLLLPRPGHRRRRRRRLRARGGHLPHPVRPHA